MASTEVYFCVWETYDGCPAHQVRVGEVQSGVQHEIRLDDSSRPLARFVEQASALHWHSTLKTMLGGEKRKMQMQVKWTNSCQLVSISTSWFCNSFSRQSLLFPCFFVTSIPAGFWEHWLLQTSHWECEGTSSLCSHLLPWWPSTRQKHTLSIQIRTETNVYICVTALRVPVVWALHTLPRTEHDPAAPAGSHSKPQSSAPAAHPHTARGHLHKSQQSI